MSTALAFEEMLAFVLAQFDPPVRRDDRDEVVLITSGQPEEVIVRLTSEDITVAEFSLREYGENKVAVEPIVIGSIMWSAISGEAAMRIVKGLIGAAREARLAKFRGCRLCGQLTAPEWLEPDDLCPDCADDDCGVVH